MSDPYQLARFVEAQASSIDAVMAELRAGQKQGHWMWFVFPQLKGLGSSPMSEFYGISGLDEAKAYLAHPVLGPRLSECTKLVMNAVPRPIGEILGSPDDQKFRSAMTLFAEAATPPDDAVFRSALAVFFGGAGDEATRAKLGVG